MGRRIGVRALGRSFFNGARARPRFLRLLSASAETFSPAIETIIAWLPAKQLT
jgi:hypothetical protein